MRRTVMDWLARHTPQHSFFTHLIVMIVMLILITTLAVGLPAYWIISTELEKQAWARVDDAERITQVSFDAEQARLVNAASLVAQRPSLPELIEAGDSVALGAYLDALRSSLDLDGLAVFDASGQVLASAGTLSLPAGTPAGTAGFAVVSEQDLALVAHQPLQDNAGEELLGAVAAGVAINDNFARQIADETGFEISVVSGTTSIATSLDSPPPAFKPADIEQVYKSNHAAKAELTFRSIPYYAVLMPLSDKQSGAPALVEIVMPVSRLETAKDRALLALAVSAAVVAVLGSLLGALYARWLTAPLKRMAWGAREIARQEEHTKAVFPFRGRPTEFIALGSALEESRTTIRLTLEELSRVKTWSEALIQSIHEGIVTFDAESKITFFSRGAARITDWPGGDVLQQPVSQILNLPESEIMPLASPPGGKRQVQIITHGGQRKTLALTGTQVIPPDSATEQTVLVLRDITDEELGRRLHSYFLGNITHEFRTPLSGLKASIELLLDNVDYLTPAELHELLNSVHLSVSGLQALVDNLLESVNIEAGRFSIHRRPVELNQVIAEAIRTMQPLLDRRSQRLSLTEPLQLPAVHADPTRLKQVIINLLANASKYGPQDETIDLELTDMNSLLKVAIVDRGPGIPEDERTRLFNRFVRTGAQTSDQVGIGLGLSVVKAIVEGHGGEVGIDERPGGGSIFWFTLPMVEAAKGDESAYS